MDFFKKYYNVIILFFANYFMLCMHNSYYVFSAYSQTFGGLLSVGAMLFAIYFVAVAISRPLSGSIIERIGIKTSMLIACFVALISCSAFGYLCWLDISSNGVYNGVIEAGHVLSCLSPQAYGNLLIVCRILAGFSYSLYMVGLFVALSYSTTDETRAPATGFVTLAGFLSMSSVIPLANYFTSLSDRLAGSVYYLAIGPVTSIISIIFVLLLKTPKMSTKTDSANPAPAQEIKWGSWKDLFATKVLVVLCFATLFMSLADGMSGSVSDLAQKHGTDSSLYMIMLSVGGIFTRFLATLPAVKRWSLKSVLPISSIGLATCIIILSQTPNAIAPVVFPIVGFLFGIALGFAFPAYVQLITDLSPKNLLPKANVAVLLSYDLGWFVTNVTYAKLYEAFGDVAILGYAAFIIILCAFCRHIFKKA
ncbi:MAG: MFS transporter [Synergistaceae bacterium]|nr:MFS transporter [Synergistaceae bacterium]